VLSDGAVVGEVLAPPLLLLTSDADDSLDAETVALTKTLVEKHSETDEKEEAVALPSGEGLSTEEAVSSMDPTRETRDDPETATEFETEGDTADENECACERNELAAALALPQLEIAVLIDGDGVPHPDALDVTHAVGVRDGCSDALLMPVALGESKPDSDARVVALKLPHNDGVGVLVRERDKLPEAVSDGVMLEDRDDVAAVDADTD